MKIKKSILVFLFILFGMMNFAQTKSGNLLDAKQQSIVSISAFAAKGDMSKFRSSLNEGLNSGLTINELKEVMVQLYAYAGFPRSLNALTMLNTVVTERQTKGIKDEMGKEPKALNSNVNKLEVGTTLQTKLLGTPMKTSIADFSPIIDVFLKEHLFADIFSRDILDFKTREIITITTLASIGNAEPQLQSHIKVGLYNGITNEQLFQMADILKAKVGATEGNSMKEILNKMNSKNLQNETNSRYAQNPWTLVYEGAITENAKGKVNIHPVNYKLNNLDIAANVYTPANFDTNKKYPTIVIAHPNGGIKEQVAGLYAQHLAERGYITITADAAYQGASGGKPRNVDKPANRIEDIHGMADFISQFKGVDVEKIGLLGICGGGGYSLATAQTDKRFKAIATLSMFNSGMVRKNGFMNSQANTIQERLQQASAARAQEAVGGEVIYTSVANPTDEEIAKIETDLYREGFVYYYRTHKHSNSTFRYTMSSLLDLMRFDATTNMDLIHQPLLMIAGSKADTYYMTDEAFRKAINAKNRELFLLEGATHIQTYWKPEYVSQAVNKLGDFFVNNLK